MELKVLLKTQKDVSDFCNAASNMKSSVTAIALNARIDAHSLMGLMTLNLSEPVLLDVEDMDEAKEAFAEWVTP